VRPIRVSVIIGTRPEAIKLAPLILAARARPDEFAVRVVRTGQHRELVDELLMEFGLRADVDLKVMQPNQDLAHVLSTSVRGLSDLLAEDRPDWVVVQGDTTTTLAGAMAAFYNRTRVAHVEAGLRSGNRSAPFPEATNRRLTTHLADLHFAPTEIARRNLLGEGVDPRAIVVTGNTVIDALMHVRSVGFGKRAKRQPSPPAAYILVTAHRRENHGDALRRICTAIRDLLERHPETVAWIPMHPNPQVRDVLRRELGHHARALLTDSLGYTAFVHALDGAAFVLTDSGGVQEECAAIGKPVLVMRDCTERPEAIDAGVARIVGTSVRAIVDAGSALLDDAFHGRVMVEATDAFGDGQASERILAALLSA